MKNIFLLPLLFLSFAQAETFQCKVVGIISGDTITCLTDQKEQVKVRLYQIDAPESGQAYGQKAKQALSDMIYGQTIDVENKGTDRYKRTIGSVVYRDFIALQACDDNMNQQSQKYHNGKLSWECNLPTYDINLKMIAEGYAWYYPFTKKNPEYQQAEQEAKAAKRGLWADVHAMPPWKYRKQKKGKK
jgi:micrococcal nuclease